MKILFVRPRPSAETIGLQHLMVVEPLELEILSALKRPNDSSILVDMILEKQEIDSFVLLHKPDMLCITGYITNVREIITYAEIGKKLLPDLVVAVGGVHCEVCPEDFQHDAIDYRFVRNAAIVFTDFLHFVEIGGRLPAGILARNEDPFSKPLPEFDFRIPIADRSISQKYRKHYFYIFQKGVALIKTSFGCPYTCSFCFCRTITQGLYRQRPMDEVMQELEQIQEKEIYIVDDDFLTDKKRLENFVLEIQKRGIHKHFLVYGRADFIAENPELIHRLKRIGLKTVIVGFESFSDEELDAYNKHTNISLYKETMAVLNKEKISCFATIIVSPEWNKEDFRKMESAVISLGIHFVNLQPLTPLPKTGVSFPQHRMLIDRSEYDKWDLAHVSVMPSKLSVAEFYRQILQSYNTIVFQPRAIFAYLTGYNPIMLFKMLMGSSRVGRQYKKKISEAERHA